MAKKDKNPLCLMLTIFIIALAGGVFSIGFYWFTFCPFNDCFVLANIEKWGQTGDFFGGVLNPFFTLLGLYFVGITIRQNQQALRQNDIELRKSSKALQSQITTAKKQQFEASFFQLLSMFNGAVKEHLVFNEKIQGNECPKMLYAYLLEKLQDNGGVSDINGINRVYAEFHEICLYRLTGYIGTLYSIIKFVDDCDELSDENKKFYTNLVRCQLSKYELSLLLYICLLTSDYGQGKFLPLVKKYDLLKYLDKATLADQAHWKLLKDAFADSEANKAVEL